MDSGQVVAQVLPPSRAKIIQKLATMREEVLNVIFLNLHKACDALDRYRCLEILEVYGMGPRA